MPGAKETPPVKQELGPGYLRDPYPVHERLRAACPVAPVVTPDGIDAWMITRYDDVRSALTDSRLIRDTRRIAEITGQRLEAAGDREDLQVPHLHNTDPPEHSRLRRLAAKALTAYRVERVRPRVAEISGELLDAMARDEKPDLVREFAIPLPARVCYEVFGVPESDLDMVCSIWSRDLRPGQDPVRVDRAGRELLKYFAELATARRRQPADDLLSALIQARDSGGGLNETEVVWMLLQLLSAHESVVNLIGNGMLMLLLHPAQRARLRADMSLLPNAIEELLRYTNPLNHAAPRCTAEPVEIGGTVISEGQFVLASLGAANRDPDRYPDADRMDFSRDTSGHLAFGHGTRYCLGTTLARLETEVAFTCLLDRFPEMTLAVDPADLRWQLNTIFNGLEELPVCLRPNIRASSSIP